MLGDTTGRMMQGQLILFTTQIHVKEMYKKQAKICLISFNRFVQYRNMTTNENSFYNIYSLIQYYVLFFLTDYCLKDGKVSKWKCI